jgi:O-antigen ligase
VAGILNFSRWRDGLPTYGVPLALAAVGVAWGLFLGRFSLLNGLLLTALAAVAIGSLLEPLVGVGAALFLGPLWAWLRAELPQVSPLIGQWVFLMAAAIWMARGLLRRDLRVPFPPLLLPLLGFMIGVLPSLWNPADVWIGFWEWAKWGQILLMFLLVYDRVRSAAGRRRAAVIVGLLAGVAVFQAAMGLWQFGLRGEGPEHFAINARFYRAYGTFEQPNPYAGFLGMMGAILAGVVLSWGVDLVTKAAGRRQRRGKVFLSDLLSLPPDHVSLPVGFAGLALLIVGAALVASWSRGAWMGFGAALLTMVAALPRRGVWGVALVAVLVVGGLGLYGAHLLPPAVADRLTGFLEYTRFEDVRGVGINDANFAVVERMAHWQSALEMWRAHFWVGVGFGCYEPAYPDYKFINWPIALGHAHNYYLNLLAETGVPGLAAYLLLLGSVFVGLWRASRRLAGWPRGLAVGLIGAWMHFAVHNCVDNILVNNVHLHLGVMLALSAWVIVTARDASAPRVAGARAASSV